jgi:hypothetical protein
MTAHEMPMATVLTAETLAELTAAYMELPWLDEIRLVTLLPWH